MARQNMAASTKTAIGRSNGLRVGTVVSVSSTDVVVDIGGGRPTPVGVASRYVPNVGDTVAVFRQDSTWLIIDRIVKANAAQAGNRLVNGEGVNVLSGADSTTSAAYVNMTTSSFQFTKRLASTRLRVEMHVSLFAATAVAGAFLGVNVNGVDTDVAALSISTASVRQTISGIARISNVPAGTYTVQGRWRRSSGTGTLTRDGGCWITIEAMEV